MPRQSDPRPERPVITRYATADGARCTKGTPGAIKTTSRSDSYFVRLKNPETGKREWIALDTNNEKEAWRKLEEKLDERRRAALGLATPELRHAGRPLDEHLDDWAAHLRAAGKTSGEQITLMLGRLRRLADLAGWQKLPHISRQTALEGLAKLQNERARGMPAGYEGRSNRTRNHYLRHLKQFVGWCCDEEELRLLRNPVARIETLNPQIDLRHARREPTDTEVGILMAYLEGPHADGADGSMILTPAVRCRMTGPQRGLGYRVCMATGYRADELRSLKRESFDLEHGTAICRAAHSKNGKLSMQHLPAWLVLELREWFAGGGGTWERFPANWPGRLLLADQEACGVAHVIETADGEQFFDFHSLRVWYCTWAANLPGVSPKTLQTMARHSDSRLTMELYAKARQSEVRQAVEQIPNPRTGRDRPNPER